MWIEDGEGRAGKNLRVVGNLIKVEKTGQAYHIGKETYMIARSKANSILADFPSAGEEIRNLR